MVVFSPSFEPLRFGQKHQQDQQQKEGKKKPFDCQLACVGNCDNCVNGKKNNPFANLSPLEKLKLIRQQRKKVTFAGWVA